MNRQFNQDIIYEVVILNDDDMQKINIVDKENMNQQGGIQNDNSSYKDDDIHSDKLLYNDDTLNNNINDYMKYLKYKIKYLELKYGFNDIN